MNNDLNIFFKGRAAAYEYLSIVFRRPPKKVFLGLSSQFAPKFRHLGNEAESADMLEGAALLEEYALYEKSLQELDVLDALNMSFTSMFNMGAFSVAATESVYLTPDGTIKQEPWEKVLDAYHVRHFTIPEDLKEPEDHISAELAFMQSMSMLCADLAENGNDSGMETAIDEQRRFLDEHILKWSDNFAGSVLARGIRKDADKLYIAAAYLLKGYLHYDRQMLKEFEE